MRCILDELAQEAVGKSIRLFLRKDAGIDLSNDTSVRLVDYDEEFIVVQITGVKMYVRRDMIAALSIAG